MSAAHLRIDSYFSMLVDLAAEMRNWPEFVAGEGYCVELRSLTSSETVTVELIDPDGAQYVLVRSSETGSLFERVTGKVIYALSANTDHVMVSRTV